jgi:hypothetical protein
MYVRDGIPRSDHDQFVALCENYPHFECRYLDHGVPIHSKAYVWGSNGEAKLAYVGSANYSLVAARGRTEELVVEADPMRTAEYAEAVWERATRCQEASRNLRVRSEFASVQTVDAGAVVPDDFLKGCPRVTLPLTSYGKGLEVPDRSGLNWGQRPDQGRNPDQAYISVPADVNRTGFFPPRGEFFTVVTDDGETFEMSRNQDDGKALHTPDNAALGRYMRKRLRVESGKLVTIEHLRMYGKLEVFLPWSRHVFHALLTYE